LPHGFLNQFIAAIIPIAYSVFIDIQTSSQGYIGKS
jgi:hypothetical protein